MRDAPGERGWDVRRTGRWRALTLLAATLVLAMSTWFSASAVIPQLRVQWDLSDSAAAWLTTAVQLGFVFGALISNLVNLPDIISPRARDLGGSARCCYRQWAVGDRRQRGQWDAAALRNWAFPCGCLPAGLQADVHVV